MKKANQYQSVFKWLMTIGGATTLIYTLLVNVMKLFPEKLFASFIFQFLIPYSIVTYLLFYLFRLKIKDKGKLFTLVFLFIGLLIWLFLKFIPLRYQDAPLLGWWG